MITVKSVSKNYGNKHVLSNIDVALEKGKIYGLLGPNGSGKTTLLKTLMDYVKYEGVIEVEGVSNRIDKQNQIAYLPTMNHFAKNLRTKDVVEYYEMFFEDFSTEVVNKHLDEFNISPDTFISKLSTGEVAAIRMALLLGRNTSIYLLDEPFNGIDLENRKRITQMILDMFTEERLIVITTHVLEEIEGMIDEVIIMKNGIVQQPLSAEYIRETYHCSIMDYYYRECVQ